MILKHGRPATVRQMVPLLFILGWIVLTIGALSWWLLRYALAAYAIVYLTGLLVGAIMAMRRHGFLVGLCTPIVFPLLHFGYGIGSLRAVIRFVILRKPFRGDLGGTSLTR